MRNRGLPFQAWLLCALGGLLIGLCRRDIVDHPKNNYEAVSTVRETRLFATGKKLSAIITDVASLYKTGDISI